MLQLNIPGKEEIVIENILLDFNGTIALDGVLLSGVSALINKLAKQLQLYVVTADTNQNVEKALAGMPCHLINLSCSPNYSDKLSLLNELGPEKTVSIGNGANDYEVLNAAIIGIAILQNEGLSFNALKGADMVCLSILDALNCVLKPNRLVATLRA